MLFEGKNVIGKYDADGYFLWLVSHSIDDTMGINSVLRSSELIKSWNVWLNAIDEYINSHTISEGVCGPSVTLMLEE